MIVQIFDDDGKLSHIIKFNNSLGLNPEDVMDKIVKEIDGFRYEYEVIEVRE